MLRSCPRSLGRSAARHLKSFSCASTRWPALPSWLTARVSASNDEDDGGNQRGDGADVGASAPWDTR